MREALEATGARVQADAPLKKRAYWRVGGCADFLVEVSTTAQLSAVLALGPAVVLGNGSNALIHDEGIRGVVLKLVGNLADLEVDGTSAWAGGGLLLTVLLSRLDKRGLAGAEPFAGVPGTVGGAVVMNAGTRLGEAADLVESAELVLPGGELVTLQAADLAFSGRHDFINQRRDRELAHDFGKFAYATLPSTRYEAASTRPFSRSRVRGFWKHRPTSTIEISGQDTENVGGPGRQRTKCPGVYSYTSVNCGALGL